MIIFNNRYVFFRFEHRRHTSVAMNRSLIITTMITFDHNWYNLTIRPILRSWWWWWYSWWKKYWWEQHSGTIRRRRWSRSQRTRTTRPSFLMLGGRSTRSGVRWIWKRLDGIFTIILVIWFVWILHIQSEFLSDDVASPWLICFLPSSLFENNFYFKLWSCTAKGRIKCLYKQQPKLGMVQN